MSKIPMFKKYIYRYQLGQTLENVSFKCLTSLKIGGTCRLLYFPDDVESLSFALKYLINNNIDYFIIGAGTNMLVEDKEFELVVISLKKIKRYYLIEEKADNCIIYIEAGVRAPIIASYLANHNITGGEFLSVIPGTIGGLTYMNAGAYKKSMSDLIETVTFFDENGNLQTVKNINDNLQFAYRDSYFKKHNNVIIAITIKLPFYQNGELPSEKIKRYLTVKKATQPLEKDNAGSTFKNTDDYSSWKIIEQLGYRGYKIGGAQVSDKHANFLINDQDCTFSDMIELINIIKKDALDKLNIKMECEWEILK